MNLSNIVVALIYAVPSTIAALAALVGAYGSYKNGKVLHEVRKEVNGKMGQLVKTASELAEVKGHADGVKCEKEAQRERENGNS